MESLFFNIQLLRFGFSHCLLHWKRSDCLHWLNKMYFQFYKGPLSVFCVTNTISVSHHFGQCSCYRHWLGLLLLLCYFHPVAVYSIFLCQCIQAVFLVIGCCELGGHGHGFTNINANAHMLLLPTHEKKHTLSPEVLSCSSILIVSVLCHVYNWAAPRVEWTSRWTRSAHYMRCGTSDKDKYRISLSTPPWFFYDGALQPATGIHNAKQTHITDRHQERCWKIAVHWRGSGNNLGGVLAGKKHRWP